MPTAHHVFARINARVSRRQRRDQGAVLMLVALSLVFIMVAVAFGVDHGRVTADRRKLQKLSDLASLDGASVINGGTTAEVRPYVEAAILNSIARNGFIDSTSYTFTDGVAVLGDEQVVSYEIGSYDTAARTFTPTADDQVPNAVRVLTTDDVNYFFQPGDVVSTQEATAMQLVAKEDTPSGGCSTLPCDTDGDGDDDCTELPCDTDGDGDDDCTELPCGEIYGKAEAFSLGSFLAGFSTDSGSLPDRNTITSPTFPDAVENKMQHSKVVMLNAIIGRTLGRTTDQAAEPADSINLPDTQLDIDLVGYQGLANTTVTLNELRAVMGFGTVTALLDATVDMDDFFQAMIDALELPETSIPTTDTILDARLQRLEDSAPSGSDLSIFTNPSLTLVRPNADATLTAASVAALGKVRDITLPAKQRRVRDIVVVSSGYESAAANAQLNVLDVVGSAAIINGDNFFATDVLIPVSSPDAVTLGLPSLLSNRISQLQGLYGGSPDLLGTYEDVQTTWPAETELVRARLEAAVLDPPAYAFGPPGIENGEFFTVAETSQINIGLTIELLEVDLSDLIPPGLLGLVPSTVGDLTVPLTVSGASAAAGLATLECGQRGFPSTFAVETATAMIHVGEAVDLSEVNPTVGDGVILEADGSLLSIEIQGSATISLAGTSDPSFGVSGPYDQYNTYRIAADPTSDLGAALFNNLSVSVPGLAALENDPLGSVVDNKSKRVADIIEARMAQVDLDVLRPLTSALGASVGGADLTAHDVKCGVPVLVG